MLGVYSGKTASWKVFALGAPRSVLKSSKMERIGHEIRTALGVTQIEPRQRLFFVQHTAGIGGTTLARQIAWDLRKDYLTLSVRRFDKNIPVLIKHLYDHIVGNTPIVVLADETTEGFPDLCEAICELDRRCILIAACRSTNRYVSDGYRQAHFVPFVAIPDGLMALLQECYRRASNLSAGVLESKDARFDEEVGIEMRTPFLIGLYYMDSNFDIASCVETTLEDAARNRYAELLAIMALCDLCDAKDIPASLARSMLGLNQKSSLLKVHPGAASLVQEERNSSQIDVLHFRHPLLSDKYLHLYSEKYYGNPDNLQNASDALAQTLINSVAQMRANAGENHLDILIKVLIQNRSTDQDVNGLSTLLSEIAVPENQRLLMRSLAEAFSDDADRALTKSESGDLLTDREKKVCSLVSHAYAHLGRLYSRSANFTKAAEAFRLVLHYMLGHDRGIYNMASHAILQKLKTIWHSEAEQNLTPEAESKMRNDVRNAVDYFDKSIEYGSPDYGYPGKLELFQEYMEYLCRTLDVHSAQRLDLPNAEPIRTARLDFVTALEEAKSLSDLDEIAANKIYRCEMRFQADEMFHDYPRTIEYYQNLVDRLKGSTDITGYTHALRGLVLTRIQAARADYPDRPFWECVKDPKRLRDQIGELLAQPYGGTYREYTSRSQLYAIWMELAKYTGCRVETGLSMVGEWLRMEDTRSRGKNPTPYYKQVLSYLFALSGATDALREAHEVTRTISSFMASNAFDSRRGPLRRIRDVIVEGTEMRELFQPYKRRTEEEIADALRERHIRPRIVSGTLVDQKYNDAILSIFDPLAWNEEEVRMDVDRNAHMQLTELQDSHQMMFIMGFGVERPIALAYCAADITNGEKLVVDAYARLKLLGRPDSQANTTDKQNPTQRESGRRHGKSSGTHSGMQQEFVSGSRPDNAVHGRGARVCSGS